MGCCLVAEFTPSSRLMTYSKAVASDYGNPPNTQTHPPASPLQPPSPPPKTHPHTPTPRVELLVTEGTPPPDTHTQRVGRRLTCSRSRACRAAGRLKLLRLLRALDATCSRSCSTHDWAWSNNSSRGSGGSGFSGRHTESFSLIGLINPHTHREHTLFNQPHNTIQSTPQHPACQQHTLLRCVRVSTNVCSCTLPRSSSQNSVDPFS